MMMIIMMIKIIMMMVMMIMMIRVCLSCHDEMSQQSAGVNTSNNGELWFVLRRCNVTL